MSERLKKEVFLELRVSPKASRNAITGWHDERLKVSVTAAPDRGKANQAVERLLADQLKLPRGAVSVVQGLTQRNKRVRLQAADDILERLPARP